jgi:hypothetical protein
MNKPWKYLPTRLTASAILSVLEAIGVSVPLSISVSAKDSRESLGYAIKASRFSLSAKELDAALAKTELTVSDRLRLKYSLECVGLY